MTVTHPDIIRYFMTIPEAARLVLQAAAMGESGQGLVLDMGEPAKIADLARDMISLAGRSEAEIGSTFTGLRPGEKLYVDRGCRSHAAPQSGAGGDYGVGGTGGQRRLHGLAKADMRSSGLRSQPSRQRPTRLCS